MDGGVSQEVRECVRIMYVCVYMCVCITYACMRVCIGVCIRECMCVGLSDWRVVRCEMVILQGIYR